MTLPTSLDFWLIQAIGIVALVCMGVGFQSKTRRRILLGQMAGALIFIVHFALLAAYTGAAMNVIVAARNFVFEKRGAKRWAQTPAWLYAFIGASAIVLLYSWQGYLSLLPVVAVAIATYGLWHNNPTAIRSYLLVSSSLWIPYSIVVQSYAGVAAQVFFIAMLLLGAFRAHRIKTDI